MNYVSCDECGVVLDMKHLFPEVVTKSSKYFNGYLEVYFVKCPVCKNEFVTKEEEFDMEGNPL